jgi:NAD-dependent dihydropyrimidine dehydrogenase PreA subunit
MKTSHPDVFAAGDVVNGPSSVVEAIASGKRAANSISRYLKGENINSGKDAKVKKLQMASKEGIEKQEREETTLLIVNNIKHNFDEIRLGFDEEKMASELDRCMTCGSKAYIAYPEDCMTCFSCEIKCPYQAIDVHPFKEVLPPAIKY